MLGRLGVPEDRALYTVIAIATGMSDADWPRDQWAREWVGDVINAAVKRIKFLRPSTNDAKVNENADGRSSSTGGHESTA